MKNNTLFTFFYSGLGFLFSSCAVEQQMSAKLQQPQFYSTPLSTENLISVPELVLSDYITEPVEFFTPALEISDQFIGAEKYLVKAKTEKLFEKREELLIDFSQLDENSFCFPLPGARIISPYGTGRGRNHTGIDLKTFPNDTIRATFDGIIRIAGKCQGYGNVIVIRHYNGLETVYGHNSKLLVKAGDKVTAGTPISLEGRTGRATTEHLHFELRINGQYFDPNLIIDFSMRKLRNNCLVFTPSQKGIRIDQV